MRRDVVDVVAGARAARPRHVLDEHARRARDMAADMAPEQARPDVVCRPWRGPDDQAQRLAGVKRRDILRRSQPAAARERHEQAQDKGHGSRHPAASHFILPAQAADRGSAMEPRHYGPFDYSPIIDRAPLKWPNGARLAIWVVPNIEYFPLDEKIAREAPVTPNIFPWSRRDYGNRIGVFRLMPRVRRAPHPRHRRAQLQRLHRAYAHHRGSLQA